MSAKVRISYDSSKPGWSATVKDAETGELVKNITALEIRLTATAFADVTVFTPEGKLYAHLDGSLDIVVDNPEMETICPYCKQIVTNPSKIEN